MLPGYFNDMNPATIGSLVLRAEKFPMFELVKKWFGKREIDVNSILSGVHTLKPGTSGWESIKAALELNPKKSFQKEWDRTCSLKSQVIQRYGYDGVKLVHFQEVQGELFVLGEWPDDCPWVSVNDCDTKVAISKIFARLSKRLPRTVRAFCEHCDYLVAECCESDWRLHYLLRGRYDSGAECFWHYVGGPPALDPQPNTTLQRFGWSFPPDLLALYAIHNGFGCADRTQVLSSDGVVVMADYMNSVAEDVGRPPDGYRFEDLLEFCPDGCGNAQCFRRDGDTVLGTVDWDHETWELSDQQTFFDFLDQNLSQLDEE